MRWTLVEVQPQAVGDDRLDHVAVRADQVGRVLAEPGVPLPDGGEQALCCMSSMDSPRRGPGKVTALGCAWTTGQSGSFSSSFSGLPVQSPYLHSPDAVVGDRGELAPRDPPARCVPVAGGDDLLDRVPDSGQAGWSRSRSSGTGASRSPSAFACARPRSSRPTPGVQPVRAAAPSSRSGRGVRAEPLSRLRTLDHARKSPGNDSTEAQALRSVRRLLKATTAP